MKREDRLNLRKFLAPEFIFGFGARKLVAQYAKNFSLSKVLIVTDPGLLAVGWPQEVCRILEEAGIATVVFSGVSENPRAEEVLEGARVFIREGCSGIVAVGGGSSIDCAKGIGILSSNGGSILDYVGIDMIPMPSPPLICVPTTGSAADISQFAIISDAINKNKLSIISRAVVPDISLVDPETTTTMPNDVTAQSGMDAFVQSIEALASNASAPITDLLALEAVRLLGKHLAAVLEQPDSLEHRKGMMLGSLYSGLTLSNASLGLVHAMSHSLGGLLDIPHGMCIGILIGPVIRFNYVAAPDAYIRIATALGLDPTHSKGQSWQELLLDKVEQIVKACGFQKKLSELGLKAEDIPLLAERALRDPCIVTNPRPATKEEVERLYGEVF